MASIRERISATTGKVTSYEITVSDGYDNNGKKRTLKKSYKPPRGLTEKQAKRELERIAIQFEDECKNSLSETAGNLRLSNFAMLYLETMKDKLNPTVYRLMLKPLTLWKIYF